MHYPYIDEQLQVQGRSMAEFRRWVRVVNEVSALSSASQVEIEFDPTYQRLVLHTLDVVRGGQRSSKLDRQRMQLLQREKGLEQQLYDGRATLSIVLDDVRVGDHVEMAYTISGSNPVFDGKFVHTSWLSSHRGPVALYRVRLLAPKEREVHHQGGTVGLRTESQLQGDWRETVFTREAVPTLRGEPGAPASEFLAEQLQFSEFANWAEVARWGEQLFARRGASALTTLKSDEIGAAHATPQARLLEALRFVQQEVRYFGTEIGASSHQPAAPDQVLSQRYGDCKDKVALLVALLEPLGIKATPVLVSTRLRSHAKRLLPSPLAFDHVIARVDLDGRSLWLDPTRAQQQGDLPARQVLGLGQGLSLEPTSAALHALPEPFTAERMRVSDLIRIDNFAHPARLVSRITYRGELAEAFRDAIATQGLATLVPQFAAPYIKAYPKLRSTAAARVDNDANDNALTVTQEFELPDLWRFPEERQLVAEVIQWGPIEWVLPPKAEARRQAMAYVYPGIYRHQVRLEFAEDVFADTQTRNIEDGDDFLRLRQAFVTERRSAELMATVSLLVDEVPAARWQAYNATLNKVLSKLSSSVSLLAFAPGRREALDRQFKALDEQLRAGKSKLTTGTQVRSQARLYVLNEQLASNRLHGALRAQALVVRGIQLDQLGRNDDAKREFEAALALTPDSVDALNASATNALTRRQFGQARELASQALSLRAADNQALGTRALAAYLAGEMTTARADWQSVLAEPAMLRRGFPLVFLTLATRRAGDDVKPLEERYPRDQWPNDWPRPLIEVAMAPREGLAAAADAAVKAARASRSVAEQLCEAYFYIGERYAADGDRDRATHYWRQAVATGVVEYVEHASAATRLAQQP